LKTFAVKIQQVCTLEEQLAVLMVCNSPSMSMMNWWWVSHKHRLIWWRHSVTL